MVIYSELTNKEYKTVEDCLKAEKKFKKEQKKKEEAAAELQRKKDEAYEKAIAACEEYLKLCGAELEVTDNGYSLRYECSDKADEIWEDILDVFLN